MISLIQKTITHFYVRKQDVESHMLLVSGLNKKVVTKILLFSALSKSFLTGRREHQAQVCLPRKLSSNKIYLRARLLSSWTKPMRLPVRSLCHGNGVSVLTHSTTTLGVTLKLMCCCSLPHRCVAHHGTCTRYSATSESTSPSRIGGKNISSSIIPRTCPDRPTFRDPDGKK